MSFNGGNGGCPSEQDLAAFAGGEMSVSATDGIVAHLTDCAACRLRLEKLEDRPDDVVLAIRRGTRQSPARSTAETPPFPDVTALDVPAPEIVSEGPGTRVGPYRLIQLLGEGGFGSVFMAEQTEPVRRQVVLKLVKLGMDTRQVLARFKAERQALAMMDHPNIARVLDAGTTERGRPYFVMELAKGVAITEYCDTHLVPTRKRLELFADVCAAVQHAHTKGVIHRDLKPSNVLVTMRDDQPVPKVIDFGIAKAVGGGRLTDQTLYTEMRQFIGTPEYMSPEQADPTALDVDARTDVYSLGVLLYELLTGSTPFTAKELRSKGIEAIGRTIREQDPPKPSTRVGGLAGETLYDVAQRRGIEPRKLAPTIKGELDWIVMKCLEKDRTHRYETANALGMDVRRYLSDEPVRAGPPSTLYQLRKFARRHRATVAAGMAVAASILIGLAVAIHGWMNASGQRKNAQLSERLEKGQRIIAENAVKRLGDAAAARRLVQADAVNSASPAGAVVMLEALRADAGDDRAALDPVRERFRTRLTTSLPGTLDRIRAACALSLLGEPSPEELVDAVGPAPASEGPLVITALRAAAESSSASPAGASDPGGVVARMNAAFAAEPGVRLRARFAIALLFTGDDRAASAMLGPSPDPTPRSAFIAEFGQWHGGLRLLPDLIARVKDDEVVAGICLAAGRVDADAIDGAERQPMVALLGKLHQESPSGAVHSATAHALTSWRCAIPSVDPDQRRVPGRGWIITTSGLTLIRIPAGFSVIGWDGQAAVPVLFTRPIYVSQREVPYSLFRQFSEDPAIEEGGRTPGWKDGSKETRDGPARMAVNMTFQEAVRFCNWLSAREGRKPCYDMSNPAADGWRLDVTADGYRLPTTPEWEYFSRAGAGTVFPCCQSGVFLQDYASLALNNARRGGALPNRWGLFDTLGGAWEMCWPVDLTATPAPANLAQGVPRPWPAIDPGDPNWRGTVYARGGADDSGTFDLRAALARPVTAQYTREKTVGFRVVCNALPAEAPPEVAIPEDPTELWLRATEQRPSDVEIVKRGLEYVDRTAHARARRLRFEEAADLFTRASELKPDDPALMYYVAALRLALKQPAAYRAACMKLLGYAMRSNQPRYIERAAKAILLDPNVKPGPEFYAAEQAARSVELGRNDGLVGWFYLVEGMAYYREAKFDRAIQTLTTTQERLRDYAPGRVTAEFFLAMAQHRSGDAVKARATFDEAARFMRPGLDADPNADWGRVWIDWLGASIAHQEAKELILGGAVKPK